MQARKVKTARTTRNTRTVAANRGRNMSIQLSDLWAAIVGAVFIFGLNLTTVLVDLGWQWLLVLYLVKIGIYILCGYLVTKSFRERFGGPLNLIKPRLSKAGAAGGLTTSALAWVVFLVLFLIVVVAGGELGVNGTTATLGLNVLLGVCEVLAALFLGVLGGQIYNH